MARPSPLRIATLSETERREPTKVVVVRIPRSWHNVLRSRGVMSDRLLVPLAAQVKALKGAS